MDQFQQAPMGGAPGGYAADKVNLPAILLLVNAGLGILLQLFGLLQNLLGFGGAAMDPAMQEQLGPMMAGGAMSIVVSIIGIAVGGFIIWGALQMKNLQNHTIAMVAAVISMIPCLSPCCILGLPFGIYALVVLMDDGVKSSFQS